MDYKTVENIKTPNGGNKMTIYWFDNDYKPTDKEKATKFMIYEYKDNAIIAQFRGGTHDLQQSAAQKTTIEWTDLDKVIVQGNK